MSQNTSKPQTQPTDAADEGPTDVGALIDDGVITEDTE